MELNKPSSKNRELYKLIDELNEYKDELEQHVISRKANRLDNIEKNAIRIEHIALDIQNKVREMRKKL